MAILRSKDLRGMEIPELEQKLSELQTELRKETGAAKSGTRPENPGRIKEIRRTIARVKTIINEKEKEV